MHASCRSTVERLDALGDHRHRLDVAAVGAHLDLVAVVDALLLGQLLADLDELLRLQDGVDARRAWSRSGSARSGDRWCATYGNSSALPNASQIVLEHPRRRVAERQRLVRMQRVGRRAASRTARSARGTALRPSCRRAKKRATPSGFMMNGPMPSSGARVGLEVRHVGAGPLGCRSSAISLRFGSQGLPRGSQEARLYRMRRLAGQANAQLSVLPRPLGIGVVAPRHHVALLGPGARRRSSSRRPSSRRPAAARSRPAARRP